jgi:uncharacterized protein YceK
MGRGMTACLMAALAVSLGGCATSINMQDAAMQKPYGGFTMPLEDFFGGNEAGDYVTMRFFPIWLLDKPLSLFGDTITLPYTLWLQRASRLHRDAPKASPGQAPQRIGTPSARGTSQGDGPVR